MQLEDGSAVAVVGGGPAGAFFTYFLLKALRGAADSNEDDAVTVGEVEVYLEAEVPDVAERLRGGLQHPQVVSADLGRVLVQY